MAKIEEMGSVEGYIIFGIRNTTYEEKGSGNRLD